MECPITVTAYDGTDFQNLYLRNTLMAKNSTSIVRKLLLSANRVPRSFQEAFYFAARAVLSTRVIGAVVTQVSRHKEIITQFAKSVDILSSARTRTQTNFCVSFK